MAAGVTQQVDDDDVAEVARAMDSQVQATATMVIKLERIRSAVAELESELVKLGNAISEQRIV